MITWTRHPIFLMTRRNHRSKNNGLAEDVWQSCRGNVQDSCGVCTLLKQELPGRGCLRVTPVQPDPELAVLPSAQKPAQSKHSPEICQPSLTYASPIYNLNLDLHSPRLSCPKTLLRHKPLFNLLGHVSARLNSDDCWISLLLVLQRGRNSSLTLTGL